METQELNIRVGSRVREVGYNEVFTITHDERPRFIDVATGAMEDDRFLTAVSERGVVRSLHEFHFVKDENGEAQEYEVI